MSLEKKDAIQGVKGPETVVKTRMGSSEHKQGWGHSFQGVLSITKPRGRVSECSQCQELRQVAVDPTQRCCVCSRVTVRRMGTSE